MKKRVYYVDFEKPMRQTLSRTVARKEFGGYGEEINYPNGYESATHREHVIVVTTKWEDGNFHMFCI